MILKLGERSPIVSIGDRKALEICGTGSNKGYLQPHLIPKKAARGLLRQPYVLYI